MFLAVALSCSTPQSRLPQPPEGNGSSPELRIQAQRTPPPKRKPLFQPPTPLMSVDVKVVNVAGDVHSAPELCPASFGSTKSEPDIAVTVPLIRPTRWPRTPTNTRASCCSKRRNVLARLQISPGDWQAGVLMPCRPRTSRRRLGECRYHLEAEVDAANKERRDDC